MSLDVDGTLLPAAVGSALTLSSNAEPQHWVAGPWFVGLPSGDTLSANPHISVDPATGTFNDYAPGGIDNAVILELEPQGGNVTLNGLQALNAGAQRRLLLMRNRDASNTITLKHENTGSQEQNRFSCPGAADHVIGTNRAYWLYYDRSRKRWTVVM